MEDTHRVVVVKSHRFFLGILVLLAVDLIWVASSELSEHIFHNESFDKPFFSTYTKTSMFLFFLSGFLCWTPWRRHHRYNHLAPTSPTTSSIINADEDDLIEDLSSEDTLSPSAFIPRNDMTDPQDSEDDRSVKFSKLVEVRHMSDKDATEAAIARMSYQASVEAEEMADRLRNRLDVGDTAKLALSFCILWFLANYTYQLGLSHTEVGVVNVMSSTSSLFTLFLAALFPSVAADKLTLSKFLCVLVSFSGVAVVSASDLQMEGSVLGGLFSLVSAFFYASYLVFLRKRVDHEDKLDIPMFFGFVGLFNLLILWPLFFVLNYSAIEPFEWPTRRQWLFLLVNGVIGTVFSEVLWLWGCFLTSSLIATLAVSLTIPMSMVADVMFKKVSYSYLFYVGSVPMLFSFFAVTLLSQWDDWDPVWEFFKGCGRGNSGVQGYSRVDTTDREELLETS